MDSYGNGYSTVGGKRSADDGAQEESESKKQRCEPSKVVHLRNLNQYVTEQEVNKFRFSICSRVIDVHPRLVFASEDKKSRLDYNL